MTSRKSIVFSFFSCFFRRGRESRLCSAGCAGINRRGKQCTWSSRMILFIRRNEISPEITSNKLAPSGYSLRRDRRGEAINRVIRRASMVSIKLIVRSDLVALDGINCSQASQMNSPYYARLSADDQRTSFLFFFFFFFFFYFSRFVHISLFGVISSIRVINIVAVWQIRSVVLQTRFVISSD